MSVNRKLLQYVRQNYITVSYVVNYTPNRQKMVYRCLVCLETVRKPNLVTDDNDTYNNDSVVSNLS